MGTNFYMKSKPPCEHCGRPYDDRHIGKSSIGWCFALHVYPDEGIHDLEDWKKLFYAPGAEIYDEYDRAVTPDEMMAWITERMRNPEARPLTDVMLRDLASLRGPNDLIRRTLGYNVIGHGSGTWDLCTGDFS